MRGEEYRQVIGDDTCGVISGSVGLRHGSPPIWHTSKHPFWQLIRVMSRAHHHESPIKKVQFLLALLYALLNLTSYSVPTLNRQKSRRLSQLSSLLLAEMFSIIVSKTIFLAFLGSKIRFGFSLNFVKGKSA